ncbi:hypothetical protein [Pedobacter sp. UC225_65]|uniref:hypothetical protein n=1 Tax=Pedobacter sp. UC225_65 TaxID=3350173 RepID=UPI003672B348
MLENLEQLIRDNAQDVIVNNNDVPNEQNEAAIQAASGSIFDTLKDQLSTGNISKLATAFNQNNVDAENPVVQQATTSFTAKLAGLGINTESAKGIGASLIPMIMAKFINKTNDPNDSSFNIQDVLGKLAGGEDGKFDFNDVTGMFTGGQNNNSQDTEGSGIVDKLKGLFN